MPAVDLIHKYLPETLWTIAEGFSIPDQFLQTMPDLVGLILTSKSMDTQEEKQSWFTLFPMMSQEQIDKLRDILTREQQKLQEIEQKYAKKQDYAYQKTITTRDATSEQRKIVQLKEQEANVHAQEAQEADNLLNQI